MTRQVGIPVKLWDEMIALIENLSHGVSPWPPIVFALYGCEDDHFDIILYKRIESVTATKVRGEDSYSYPGLRKANFYPPPGTGKWFSGTLVVGDGLDLDKSDESGSDKWWMRKDGMDFRIKMDRQNPHEPWEHRVYVLDVHESSLAIANS